MIRARAITQPATSSSTTVVAPGGAPAPPASPGRAGSAGATTERAAAAGPGPETLSAGGRARGSSAPEAVMLTI